MPVVDLYIPDRLPVVAEYEIAHACARLVDAALRDVGRAATPCLVYVHRIAVFAVVTATEEGVMTLRAAVSLPVEVPELADRMVALLEEHRGATERAGTEVVVSVTAPTSALTSSGSGPFR